MGSDRHVASFVLSALLLLAPALAQSGIKAAPTEQSDGRIQALMSVWSQCGDKDGVWAGKACMTGLSCLRVNEWYMQCQPEASETQSNVLGPWQACEPGNLQVRNSLVLQGKLVISVDQGRKGGLKL